MILLRQNRPKRKVHNGRILQFGRLMNNRELVVQSTIMRSPKGGGGGGAERLLIRFREDCTPAR